ncbi:uncharacterized protein METZ01_LOCUS90766, partial [marine metagenome]
LSLTVSTLFSSDAFIYKHSHSIDFVIIFESVVLPVPALP